MAPFPASIPNHSAIAELTECVIREADLMASLTIAFIDRTGVFPPERRLERPVALPATFLLELAAVLRIAVWECHGLRAQLPSDLPTAEYAYADLLDRAAHRPESFSSDLISPPLHRRVMDVTLRYFAWNGRRDWGADVLSRSPRR